MDLEIQDERYSFPASSYESWDLEDPEMTVTEVSEPVEMREAAQDTGSCLLWDEEPTQDYLDTFSSSDNVHFYDIEGVGYARSVELETSEGEALAVDAVRTTGDFMPDVYRAGVNGVFRHADAMGKDVVLGGDEFFRDTWLNPLDLTYDQPDVTPAEDVFFDQKLSEEEIDVRHEQKPYTKGEQWDESEEYFVSWL